MKILSIKIVTGSGPDRICLSTDLPNSVWPFDENLTPHFEAVRGTSEEYVKKHFPGIPYEIIDTSGSSSEQN